MSGAREAEQSPARGAIRAGPAAWWMLAVLVTFYALSFVNRSIASMLVPPIKADLHLNDFQISLLLGPAFAVFYALAGFPFGWAADRFQRRWVIFTGVFLWSLATALSGLARSFEALLLGRIAVGVAEAALTPAAYTLIADKFPKARLTTAMAVYQGGARVGPASAFTVAGVAIAVAQALIVASPGGFGRLHDWQIVMALVGAPGMLLACLVFTFREPARLGTAGAGAPNHQLLFGFLKQHAALILLMLAGFSLINLCANAAAWVPAFIERRWGWTPLQFGPILTLTGFISAGVLVLKGAAIDWLYARGMKDAHIRFFIWLLAATVPIAWFVYFIPNPVVFLLVHGLFEVVALNFMLYVSATLALIAPNQIRGQLNAIFLSLVVLLGMGTGPTVVGAITTYVLHDERALGTALTITVGGSASASLFILVFTLPRIRRAVVEQEQAS
jgi:MFS family permease